MAGATLLRPWMAAAPFFARRNTRDNTPAITHVELTTGDEALLFGHKPEQRWEAALATIGIDPRLLSAEGGRA